MFKPLALAAISAVFLSTTACVVQDKKNGGEDSVRIHTPVGGLEVHTNDVHPADIGLPMYPGATLVSSSADDKNKSANIEMSFGDWHLRVKVIGYQSSDPQDKVVAFYRQALGRYGDVLTCQNNKAVGTPEKTSEGLTCSHDASYNIDLDVKSQNGSASVKTPQLRPGNFELRAGSPHDQHIVSFDAASGTGTKFALVAVEFPHRNETN